MPLISPTSVGFTLALLVAGCEEESETLVDVYFEAGPDSELRADNLSVTVVDRTGRDVLVERYAIGGADSTLPIGVRVRPLGEDASAGFTIHGQLETEGTAFSFVSARVPFVAGESRELRLRFEDTCADVADCGAEATCLAGGCTSFCYAPTADGFVLRGCEQTDAGSVDAGQVDSGTAMDAGPPDAGSDAGRMPHLRSLAAGNVHSCVVMQDGPLYCWGANPSGQIGNGSAGTDEVVPIPSLVDGLPSVVDVAVGEGHTCAITDTGDTYCWGENCCNALGLGGSGGDELTPQPVIGADSAIQVVAGGQHTCIVRDTGTMFCWGRGSSGQLGRGGTGSSESPTLVQTANVLEAHSGSSHVCAVISDGTLQCWGKNDLGQLGDGMPVPGVDVLTPAPVPGITTAVEVGGGRSHTCVRLANGTVHCFGRNYVSQLGRSTPMRDWSIPGPVMMLSTATTIADGHGYHSCAIVSGGTLSCWGYNNNGQLGRASTGDDSDVPTPVMVLGAVTAVELGFTHSCAIEDGRDLYCWGENDDGQLGIGTMGGSVAVPLQVNGLPDP